jgi:hypothetical protein
MKKSELKALIKECLVEESKVAEEAWSPEQTLAIKKGELLGDLSTIKELLSSFSVDKLKDYISGITDVDVLAGLEQSKDYVMTHIRALAK